MEHVIPVSVHRKVARNESKLTYVCGNSDFVVEFSFDEDWDGLDVKTARFKSNGKVVDVVFTGNRCEMPAISNTHTIEVGVFTGNLKTTTPAIIMARKSILCGGGVPADPTPEVYGQIMEILNAIEENRVTDEQVQEAVNQYLKDNPIDTGVNFTTDATLTLNDDGILSVNTANDVEQDNTLPVTSAAVFAEVGNINALLETI